MIKYLGSKRLLLPQILDVIQGVGGVKRVGDLFAGTSRVGQALKEAGYQVVANDHNTYSHVLARCYVQADAREVKDEALRWIQEFNSMDVAGEGGWFTDVYCRQARYFQPENGVRIEAIRQRIAEAELGPDLEAVLLVSLMEAADRVDSTTGVQMAYLKSWAARSSNRLEMRLPRVLPGKGKALQLDAEEAAREMDVDLVYVDPPYNQHSYLGNYHIWETLVLWDQPEVYGVARKRVDCKERKSAFNSKPGIRPAFERLLAAIDAPWLLLSFNDEGYLSPEELGELLSTRGEVRDYGFDHPRYVGARIGIHNHKGIKVGRVSHLRNREHLFLVGS